MRSGERVGAAGRSQKSPRKKSENLDVKKKNLSASRRFALSLNCSLSSLSFLSPLSLDTPFPPLSSPQAPSDEDKSYHGGGKRPHIAEAERGGDDAAAGLAAAALPKKKLPEIMQFHDASAPASRH